MWLQDGETLLDDASYQSRVFDVSARWADVGGDVEIYIDQAQTQAEYVTNVTFSTLTIWGVACAPSGAVVTGWPSHNGLPFSWEEATMTATIQLDWRAAGSLTIELTAGRDHCADTSAWNSPAASSVTPPAPAEIGGISALWLLGALLVVCATGVLVSLCKGKHAKGSGSDSIYGDAEALGGDRPTLSMTDRIIAWVASF